MKQDRYDNDVFISYSQHQRRAAELVRDVLRENMLTCWIAPECIPAGSDYTAEIPRAIHGCKVLVLILSSDAQRSQWVCSEINTAISEKKIIIPFAVQNCRIESQFDFAISKSQRIIAYKHLSSALEELVEAVYALVQRDLVPVQQAYLKRRLRLYRRRRLILTLAAIVLAAGVFTGAAFAFGRMLDKPREQERFVSGSIGSCAWEYHEDTAELVISGEGSTYVNGITSPWEAYAGEIRSLRVEEGVTELGYNLMDGCTSLTEVSLPAGLTKMYGGVFANCTSLEAITLPDGMTDIGIYAFSGCKKLQSIQIPASVTRLAPNAFEGAGLSEISVSEDNPAYRSVDGVLFNKDATVLISFPGGYEQTAYVVPEGTVSIGANAFSGCTALRSVVLPQSVTEIGDNAFYTCSALTNVAFPLHLTDIGKKAFANTALQEVILPASVSGIGEEAFSLCLKLKTVVMDTAMDTVEQKTFFGCSHLDEIVLGSSLRRIEAEAFKNCAGLKEIAIPDSVSRIDDTAFNGCRHLTLIGSPGSEAERCAQTNGLNFLTR